MPVDELDDESIEDEPAEYEAELGSAVDGGGSPAEPAVRSIAEYSAEEFERLMSDPARFGAEAIAEAEGDAEELRDLPAWATESADQWQARLDAFYRGDTGRLLP